MLNQLIHRLVGHRHYWRDVGFDELSELYASTILRGLASNLIGIFIPVYLYKIGYPLKAIFAMFAMFFVLRILFDFLSAFIVARIGPKHAMVLSTCFQLVFLGLMISLKDLHWPLLLIALFWSASMSLYLVAYHVDFSKIKHSLHSGKEIGFMFIFERIGGVLGPLAGGLLATFFDPRYTIGAAMFVFIISLVPILLSQEPVKVNQKITFKGLDWRTHARDYVTLNAFYLENTASIMLWPLLVAVVVFKTDTFAKLGVVTALSTAITLLVTHFIGVFIDKNKGGQLMRNGVLANALLHALRPFLLSPIGAVSVYIANDPITVSYKMPMTKGYYDAADSLPGYRIAFIASQEMAASATKAIFWAALWLLSMHYSAVQSMRWIYLPVAVYSLLMLTQNFRALKGQHA